MAFAGEASIPGTSRINLLSGIAVSGKYYRVYIHNVSANTHLSSSVSATTGINNPTGLTLHNWDGATALYAYNSNGGAETIKYVVTEVPTVGLAVTCS